MRTMPLIDGVHVDLDRISRLAHRCEPLNCRHREGCCQTYEVFVDEKQVSGIVGMLPEAARYAHGLLADGAYAEVMDDTEGGTCLATHEDGTCVFAFKDERGATLCSIHAAALELGLPPAKTKPLACALWPLFLVEGDPDTLTVQEGVLDFPCNTVRTESDATLDNGVAGIIDAVFGRTFLRQVEQALRNFREPG